jgi:hypothetical protein
VQGWKTKNSCSSHDFSDSAMASPFLKHLASMARVEITKEQAFRVAENLSFSRPRRAKANHHTDLTKQTNGKLQSAVEESISAETVEPAKSGSGL